MRRRRLVLVVHLVALLAGSLWLRASSLGAIPEVHADEAWHGVQAGRILSGEPFETRVYSGNPISPFYTGMVLPLLATFGPQPWVVRAPALICGVLAVVVLYMTMRRTLGEVVATIAAMILAVLPSAIVLSRVGFDCSQQPLAAVAVLYFAFRRKPWGLVVAMAAALVVHPTSLFLLPIAVPVFLARTLPTAAETPSQKASSARGWGLAPQRSGGACPHPRARSALKTGDRHLRFAAEPVPVFRAPLPYGTASDTRSRVRLVIGTAILAILATVIVAVPASHRPYAEAHAARFYRTPDWGRFLAGMTRFHLALSLPPHEPHLIHRWLVPASEASELRQTLALGLPASGLLVAGLFLLVRGRKWDRVALVAGVAASAGLLHVAGGAAVMESTFRYAAFLVAPTALALAVLVESLLAALPPRRRSLGVAALIVAGWVLLGCARTNWFEPRLKGSREALRTLAADVEDSHRIAVRDACRDHRVILAQDYWSYYPLAYYAWDHPGVRVERPNPEAISPDAPQPGLIDRLKAGAVAVGFPGGGLARAVAESPDPGRVARRDLDLNGRRWLEIYRWQAPGAVAQ